MKATGRDSKTVIGADTSKLSFLFRKGKYEVPWHQRYYDWGNEDVSDLLDDLQEAVAEERECYFLGAIMLVEKDDDLWEINDGQQRMVTFSLICARLVRIFYETGDALREQDALRILFDIGEYDRVSLTESDTLFPRLTPPENDKTNYNTLIRGKDVSPNGKLTKAWRVIDEYFESLSVDEATSFFDFLIRKLEVACIHVPRQLNPNAVFETLNARGKPLSEVDLIRNHIYSFFGNAEGPRRDTVHDHLEQMRVGLGGERSKTKVEEYIRCYLQCRFGYLRKDRLYRELKSQIRVNADDSPDSDMANFVYGLVEDMARGERIVIFHSISSPRETDPLISRFIGDAPGKPRRNLFIFLSELKYYTVCRPIVFALLDRYVQEEDRAEKRKIARFVHTRLKLLTSFVIRTALAIRQFQPSHLDRQFATLAQQVMSASSLDDVDFYGCLREVDDLGILDDSNFIALMERATIRSSYRGKAKRFLLGMAYKEQSGLTINETAYTVEHILPVSQSHLGYWPRFDEQSHQANVHRIGNLTLLSNSDNKPGAATNRSFTRKQEIFSRSTINLTSGIAKVKEWSPGTIEKRQKGMAKLAAQVWDIPNGFQTQ